MESKELNIGIAGEHFVMYELISKGYHCFQTAQGMNYDVVLDLSGRLLKLQVKTTIKAKQMSKAHTAINYIFHVRRAGKGGKRVYNVGEFDGFACVSLQDKLVAYVPFKETVNKTLLFRDRKSKYGSYTGKIAPYLDEFPIENFIRDCK